MYNRIKTLLLNRPSIGVAFEKNLTSYKAYKRCDFIHSFAASPVPSAPGKPGSPYPFRGSRPGKETD